jgi:hypothetical protein
MHLCPRLKLNYPLGHSNGGVDMPPRAATGKEKTPARRGGLMPRYSAHLRFHTPQVCPRSASNASFLCGTGVPPVVFWLAHRHPANRSNPGASLSRSLLQILKSAFTGLEAEEGAAADS